MSKLKELGIVFSLLGFLVLVFWSPALLPGKALFLRDFSVEVLPHRNFWVRSGGFALWNPYEFFGSPYSANSQNGAFYPLNLLFFWNPLWRGLSFYIIFHYLLAGFFSYLLFQELGFSKESSFFSAVSFCFSGIFCSFSNLIVLLSVASWLSVSGWLLVRSLKAHWLLNIFLLGIIFGVQFFAGDPHIFGECLLIDLALGLSYLFKSEALRGSYFKLVLGLGVALLIGLILASPQIWLTLEMFSYSNRAQGYSFEDFALWSLIPKNLWTLFFPNYFLSPDSRFWLLGFFRPPSYLLSLYPGILVLFLALGSVRESRRIAILWAGIFWLGIFFALGKYNPLVSFIFRLVPFLSFIRIPEKFYLWSGVSLVVLAGLGLESFLKKPLSIKNWYLSLIVFGVSFILLIIFFILKGRGFASEDVVVAHQFLIGASAVRSLSLLLAGMGWLLVGARIRSQLIFGLGMIFLIYLDLGYAHFRLNPTTDSRFYTEIPEIIFTLEQIQLGSREQSRVPIRVAVIGADQKQAFSQASNAFEYYLILREWLSPFWGVYFRVNDVLTRGSYYLSARDKLLALLKASAGREQIFARCGVEFLVSEGGLKIVPGALSRAMVFYQAELVSDPERLVQHWLNPGFPYQEKILLEEAPEPISEQVDFPAERAEIMEYENERIRIKVNAKAPGWLVLLDSFYPGWQVYVDGREEKIFRANYFFRAVKVPGGEHYVEFRYLPNSFKFGVVLSGVGFLVWILGLIFSLKRWKRSS